MATTAVEKKVDILLERTLVLEQVGKQVAEHDVILRGVNKDDGLVTEVPLIKVRQDAVERKIDGLIESQDKARKENKDTVMKIALAFGVPLLGFVGTFVWGLLTQTISVSFAP